jgi:heterodisulfide reductase subunit C
MKAEVKGQKAKAKVAEAETAAELLVNDLDLTFRDRLAEKVGDSDFMHCLSCGSCSASCPVRRLEEKYNPRRIIRMAIMGMKEEVYASEFVWICSYHSTCLHRCPQGVNIGAVADAVVRIAEERAAEEPRMNTDEHGSSGQTITAQDMDRDFKKQMIAKVPELGRCFTCGSCTAVCPEALMDPAKDPRAFIRKVNLGLAAEAMADEFKDICATHFRCLSRCPQGVHITKIMNAIRELAVEDGHTYPAALAALEKRDGAEG